MNAEDRISWTDSFVRLPLTCVQSHLNCTEPYGSGNEPSMNDDANRFGLRLVEQLYETSLAQRNRNRIRRGIVWQVAYGPWLTHFESAAASPQRSNHPEHLIASSSPITPYTN
jgi:hypothetical protein